MVFCSLQNRHSVVVPPLMLTVPLTFLVLASNLVLMVHSNSAHVESKTYAENSEEGDLRHPK
jgi:hypothetical protein